MWPAVADAVKRTPEARNAELERAVAEHVNAGWRVKSQADYEARLEKGSEPSTRWQVILTVLTVGMYGRIKWALAGGTRRKTVSVDEYGNIVEQLSKNRGL